MQDGIPIVEGVNWVGTNDRKTNLFEAIGPIPRGVSYNCYLLLIEPTVDARFSGTPEQIEQCHELGRKMVERLHAPQSE